MAANVSTDSETAILCSQMTKMDEICLRRALTFETQPASDFYCGKGITIALMIIALAGVIACGCLQAYPFMIIPIIGGGAAGLLFRINTQNSEKNKRQTEAHKVILAELKHEGQEPSGLFSQHKFQQLDQLMLRYGYSSNITHPLTPHQYEAIKTTLPAFLQDYER